MADHGELNIKLYYQYIENLARMHEDIQHDPDAGKHRFTRMFLDDFLSAKQVKLDGSAPCVLVEPYEGGLVDNKSNNILSQRNLAYMVVMKVPERGNQMAAIDLQARCEKVAFELLSRIYKDRFPYTSGRFANVMLNEVEDAPIDQALDGGWVGWRVMVPVQNVNRLVKYDAGRWNDDNAKPLLQDLTGLSCANLNHPTLGLTVDQRTNCLYVTIYEADGVTVRARIRAGGSYTLTDTDMAEVIVRKSTRAAAAADNATVVTDQQFLLIEESGETYVGNGGTVAALVADQVFLLPVKGEATRIGVNSLTSIDFPFELQVNETAP